MSRTGDSTPWSSEDPQVLGPDKITHGSMSVNGTPVPLYRRQPSGDVLAVDFPSFSRITFSIGIGTTYLMNLKHQLIVNLVFVDQKKFRRLTLASADLGGSTAITDVHDGYTSLKLQILEPELVLALRKRLFLNWRSETRFQFQCIFRTKMKYGWMEVVADPGRDTKHGLTLMFQCAPRDYLRKVGAKYVSGGDPAQEVEYLGEQPRLILDYNRSLGRSEAYGPGQAIGRIGSNESMTSMGQTLDTLLDNDSSSVDVDEDVRAMSVGEMRQEIMRLRAAQRARAAVEAGLEDQIMALMSRQSMKNSYSRPGFVRESSKVGLD
ncbi:hypothetical protein TWF281_002485 [Arthrobotrys megalospora]